VHWPLLQLYDIEIPFLTLLIRHQQVYHGLPSMISYNHPDIYAPYLGVLKVYENLVRPVYLIMYLSHQSVINITTSPQHCPQASSLLLRDVHFDCQESISPFQTSSNIITSVKMALNISVFMMKTISVFVNRTSIVLMLNALVTIFKVIETIITILFAFAHLVSRVVVANSVCNHSVLLLIHL
jgi:hypothetical protein